MRQITKQTVSKRMGVSNKISALETVFPKSQQTAACHVSILVGNENKQAGDDQHNSKQHRGRERRITEDRTISQTSEMQHDQQHQQFWTNESHNQHNRMNIRFF